MRTTIDAARVRTLCVPLALPENLKVMTHGMADIEPGLRLHYVTEGEGPRTLVLLHGFPQTWWEWHEVIADFVEAGFRVVAPDYRGAGNSWRPPAATTSARSRPTSAPPARPPADRRTQSCSSATTSA